MEKTYFCTVGDVYDAIDAFAPFSTQEKWDNSGLLIGDRAASVSSVVTCTDITPDAIQKAAEVGAQLIVSHHPVIFTPMKRIASCDPVYRLIEKGIAAICVHTPLDIAPRGINGYDYDALCEVLNFIGVREVLEVTTSDGRGFGWIHTLCESMTLSELGAVLREVFHAPCVRGTDSEREVQKIAFCAGAGASMLEKAYEKGCDVLITGDVKHDRWMAAQARGMALIDMGHYAAEKCAALILAQKIKLAYPALEVTPFEPDDPAPLLSSDREEASV